MSKDSTKIPSSSVAVKLVGGEASVVKGEKKIRKKDGGSHAVSTLFIHNIPVTAGKGDLESSFGEYGPVRSAFIVKNGIGFVHFALAEDTGRALEGLAKGSISVCGQVVKGELALRKGRSKDADVIKKDVRQKKEALKKKDTLTKKDTITKKDTDTDIKKEDKPVAKRARITKDEQSATTTTTPSVINTPILIIQLVGEKDAKTMGFDKKQLYKKMRKTGDFKELVYPFEDDKSKAKLVFTSTAAAIAARKKVDSHLFKGHRMTIIGTTDARSVAKQHRLIIRNLSFTVNKEDLEDSLKTYGSIVEVTLPSKAPNMNRGFAFIQMETKESAEKIIELVNGNEICGRVVAIDWALDKRSFEKQNVDEVAVSEGEIDVVGNSDAEVDDDDNSSEIDVETVSDAEEREQDEEEEKNNLVDTVFIRNVPFSADEEALTEVLSHFGPLEYCKIVMDIKTGATRGTAFAKFKSPKSALKAIEASNRLTQAQLDEQQVKQQQRQEAIDLAVPTALETSLFVVGNRLDNLARKRTGKDAFKSILDQSPGIVIEDSEIDNNEQKGIVIDGRALSILPAVDRKSAEKMKNASKSNFSDSGPQDNRNLYLLNEGLLKPKTAASRKFWPAIDTKHREDAVKERRREFKTNHNIFVSKTRLSLRHLPLPLTEADIKKVLRTAVERAFVVQENQTEGHPVLDDRVIRNESMLPHYKVILKQVKIIRDKERDRSKGYAFAEFICPVQALLALRYLKDYEPGLWRELAGERCNLRNRQKEDAFRTKAPLVEFATEKMSVITKRNHRLAQQQAAEGKANIDNNKY